MERYEAYKDSGVKWLGEIPVTWTCGRIRSVYALRKELVEDGEPDELVSVSEYYGVDYRRNRISSSDVLVRADSLEGYQLCYPDDLVMNIMLAWKGAQGTSAIKGLVSPSYGVFRPLEGSCPRYYHYLMRTDQYKEYFKSYSSGIIDSRLRLYPEVFLHLNCHVPPLEEQQAIADYLDAKTTEIDALVADCEREVGLLQEYRKAVISEAVTKGLDPDVSMKDSGVEWIGEIPAGWHCTKLGLISISTLGRMLDTEKQTGDCLAPYLSNRDVQWFRIDDSDLKEMDFPYEMRESYEIHDGDMLVCEGGEVGRSTVWHGPTPTFYFQKAIHRVRFDTSVMDPDFAAYQMFQKAQVTMFREVRKGESTIGHLPGDQLRQLTFVVPPIDEQHNIVAHLDVKTAEIGSLIEAKQTMADKLREYRRSLISEAVTGKFKVPGV